MSLKAPSPVILKFPPSTLLKSEQSKFHSMCQADGARNRRLLPLSLLVLVHRTSEARVDWGWLVVGTTVAVALVTVVVDTRVVTVVSLLLTPWSPRSPSRATTAATPMTPARRTDQRRYQGGLVSSIGNLRGNAN